MTKIEFLNNLKVRLSYIPYSEVEKSLEFYSESIDDRMEEGLSEEEAVAQLGDIDKIVQDIELDMPMPMLIGNKIRNSHKNTSKKSMWMIIMICSLPILLPLGLAFIMIIFAIYLVIWSLILVLYSLLLACACALIGGMLKGAILLFVSPPAGIMFIGLAVFFGGVLISSINPVIGLSKQLVKLTSKIIKKIKRLVLLKQGE